MELVSFFVIAILAVASALGVILRRNTIHAALFLVVNLGSVAALYLMLRAEFLAAAQVIIYAGAIMVLFIFAIMVLIPGKEETSPDSLSLFRRLALPLGVLLLGELVLAFRPGLLPAGAPPSGPPPGSVESLGRLLFTDYLFAFEVTSVLLLAAMVGVLALAKRRAS